MLIARAYIQFYIIYNEQVFYFYFFVFYVDSMCVWPVRHDSRNSAAMITVIILKYINFYHDSSRYRGIVNKKKNTHTQTYLIIRKEY